MVAGLLPALPAHALKSPWARLWTPRRSWWLLPSLVLELASVRECVCARVIGAATIKHFGPKSWNELYHLHYFTMMESDIKETKAQS